jgi:hypothetical protein
VDGLSSSALRRPRISKSLRYRVATAHRALPTRDNVDRQKIAEARIRVFMERERKTKSDGIVKDPRSRVSQAYESVDMDVLPSD